QQSQKAQRNCRHENRLHDLIVVAIWSALGIHDSPSRGLLHCESSKLSARNQSFAGGMSTRAAQALPAVDGIRVSLACPALPPSLLPACILSMRPCSGIPPEGAACAATCWPSARRCSARAAGGTRSWLLARAATAWSTAAVLRCRVRVATGCR